MTQFFEYSRVLVDEPKKRNSRAPCLVGKDLTGLFLRNKPISSFQGIYTKQQYQYFFSRLIDIYLRYKCTYTQTRARVLQTGPILNSVKSNKVVSELVHVQPGYSPEQTAPTCSFNKLQMSVRRLVVYCGRLSLFVGAVHTFAFRVKSSHFFTYWVLCYHIGSIKEKKSWIQLRATFLVKYIYFFRFSKI